MKKPAYKDIIVLDNGRQVYVYDEKAINKRTVKKNSKISIIKSDLNDIIDRVIRDIQMGIEPAAVVGLILCTYERVGNDASAANGHYGASNLERHHVKKSKNGLILDYMAKSGVHQRKEVSDPLIVSEIERRIARKKPNDRIFSCTPKQVNDYLSQFNITSKDIRTFAANKFMSDALRSAPKYDKQYDRRRVFAQKLKEVAEVIGHKPQTLNSMYLTPALKKNYVESGKIKRFVRRNNG